jgi:hypothetical protein
MVTEPEAAAIYAARYLKLEMQKDFLKVLPLLDMICEHAYSDDKPGECFVLCDAGGGTVVSSHMNQGQFGSC